MRRFTKRRRRIVLLGAVAILVVIAFTQWRAAITRNRQVPDEPFRIAGNLYYVGHTGVTSFLLTGPEGHVLIDGGYPENGPMIIDSISKLGFDIADVKVLLNSHAHSDHAGGLRALQEASGAELWISEGDADVIAAGGAGDPSLGPFRFFGFLGLGRFPAPRVDHRFADGVTISLGSIALTANVTAGHTRGCTSWSFPVFDGDRELLAVSICSLKLFPFVSVVEPEAYPGIRADFERSFSTLRSLPADIFLASHPNWFDMHRKRREQTEAECFRKWKLMAEWASRWLPAQAPERGVAALRQATATPAGSRRGGQNPSRNACQSTENPADPFVDRAGYLSFIDRAEVRFIEVLADQQ